MAFLKPKIAAPAADPSIAAQQALASDKQATAIQGNLSADQLNLMRQFGGAQQMAGTRGIAAPMAKMAGM